MLPLHGAPRANLESGILKTVDVRVGTAKDDRGLAANEFARQ